MAMHLIGLALFMGAIISIYLPMISQTARILGSAPMANVPFFAIALIASIVIAFATGSRAEQFQKITSLPFWLLTAGVMSAGMIIGSSFLIPKIGIGAFFVLLVSGQVLAGMAFGYFGLFGVPASAMTLGKATGAALVIAGVYLVTFR
ncbi:DMT family transporter [Alisedimentitalea sp. MJ-SS2]|uniref:DMT family transporter n=1 Tax=Aliisedimentitalea sp. MJ-SS2 TaxID=3049795 RepID=UPI00291540F8|nr:DMT family transporter [Alisedimentitalea sp. MJ-SS2]MDU8926265.1 DMT family transporter [Alisedimentitalea sp. MJ-SS2]